MAKIETQPWLESQYTTTWGSGTDSRVGYPQLISRVFGDLAWALNGTLSASNFERLTALQIDKSDPKKWAHRAIRESKINFDPYDGHDHSQSNRGAWEDHKITKKNIDSRSARLVWTALEGMPGRPIPHGMTVIGGVKALTMSYLTSITLHELEVGWGPHGDMGAVSWVDHRRFIRWTDAKYWQNIAWTSGEVPTTYTNSDLSPFKPGVMPVVIANMLVPGFATFARPPLFASVGTFSIMQQPLDDTGYCFGFWPFWTGYQMHTSAAMSTTHLTAFVPWIAIGPGGYGWV